VNKLSKLNATLYKWTIKFTNIHIDIMTNNTSNFALKKFIIYSNSY